MVIAQGRIYTQTEYKQDWRNFTMDSICPTYCYIYQDNGCLWCLTTLSTILQLYCGVGNRSATRKPPVCHKSLTNIITLCCIEYTSPWSRFELTTLVVIGADCKMYCLSNYHAIMTTTVPVKTINHQVILAVTSSRRWMYVIIGSHFCAAWR